MKKPNDSEINKGRPLRYSESKHLPMVEKMSCNGATVDEMCFEIGISRSTFYRWIEKYRPFRDAVKKGRDVAIEIVEETLFKRACGYTTEETTVSLDGDGNKNKTTIHNRHVPPSEVAMIFYLKNMCPEKWRDKQETANEKNIVINIPADMYDYPDTSHESNKPTIKTPLDAT